MINTFNRRPLSVNTPDNKDVEHKYLNQFNWKGLVDNKNFLAVDQESFADCNNVYVDEQGLLKSRPSLKLYSPDKNNEYLHNVLDVWNFGTVIVYKTKLEDKYYLVFEYYDTTDKIKKFKIEEVINDDFKLIVSEHKIFVFSYTSFKYFDMETFNFADAEDFVYVPVTKIYENGIEDEVKFDTPNKLTKSEITRYIYDNINSSDFTRFIGKDLTLTLDGINYNINFVNKNELVFVTKYTSLEDSNYSNDFILGKDGGGIPLVEVSENGVVLITSYVFDEVNKKISTWNVYWTVDGKVLKKVAVPDGMICPPKISANGFFVIAFLSDGPYIISIIETEYFSENDVRLKYETWTNLCELQSNQADTYKTWNMKLDNFYSNNEDFVNYKNTVCVNGSFFNDESFAFTYSDRPTDYGSEVEFQDGTYYYKGIEDTSSHYSNMYCVTCNKGRLSRTELFRTEMLITTNESKTPNNTTDTYKSWFVPGENNVKLIRGYNRLIFDEPEISLTLPSLRYYEYNDGNTELEGTTLNVKLDDKDYIGAINTKSLSRVTENNPVVKGSLRWSFDDLKVELFYKITWLSDTERDIKLFSNPVEYTYKPFIGNVTTMYYLLLTNSKPVSKYRNNEYYIETYGIMPSIKIEPYQGDFLTLINFQGITIGEHVLLDFKCALYDWYTDTGHSVWNYDASYYENENINYIKSPLKQDMLLTNDNLILSTQTKVVDNKVQYLVHTKTITSFNIPNVKIYEDDLEDFSKINTKFSRHFGYILTNKYLFPYTDYTGGEYTPIKLLFEAKPIVMYYYGNNADGMYIANENTLFSNTAANIITLDVLDKKELTYFVPNLYTHLTNYYFAKDKTLYISFPKYNKDGQLLWYFPEINEEDFNYNITNLHPISSTEVAIFLPNEIYYTTYDDNLSAYRYYKSKIQVGCKEGSDVITTFDGKYIIFPSERGLVAMSYQQFVATTEQSLDYLSDNIYSTFYNYLTESNSKNEIKLYKHSYWIFVYKQDSKKGFLLDMRNLSWWPIEGMYNTSKFVEMNNKTVLLSNNKLFSLNTSDVYYFDNDGKLKARIRWFVKSQKLHLNALNYYKHIVNITFASVHDVEALKQSQHNIQNTNLKLQVNNYRKKIDGNIDSKDDWSVVHYNIDIVRTYIQRLNYSKVNEFQYMLSYDNQTALNVPLSLSNITIKYKIGGQIR